MSSSNFTCSQPGRLLNKGVVLIHGQQNPEILYLKAKSGGVKSEPARLELYSDVNYTCLNCEVSFTNIKNIKFKEDKDLQITITKTNGNDVTFHTYSDEATKEWIQYCLLLFTVPRYPIAEPPKEMFVSKELISQYSNPQIFGADRVWVVYILCEGIGGVINMTGLHILALDYHDHKFRFYDYKTNECLLTWDGCLIRRCGYFKSLVFIEAGRRCHGGPGLLWMQHPIPFSTELCECLYKFLKIDLKVAPSCYTATSSDSTEVPKYSVARTTTVRLPCEQSSGPFKGSQMQNPSQDCSRQINSSHNQSSYTNGTNSSATNIDHNEEHRGCYTDDDISTAIGEPLLKINIGNSSTATLKDIPHSDTTSLPLPSKPKFENVCKKMAPDDQPYISDHQSNSPPQVSTTHGSKAKDQRSSYQKCAYKSSHIHPFSEVEERAFRGCSVIISKKLDISAILAHLNAQGLLTTKDHQTLTNKYITDSEKIEYLIYILPRKGNDFFAKFMLCLCESKSGTGHDDIIKALTKQLNLEKDNMNNERKDEDNPQQAGEENENEPYPTFIDLPDGVHSVKVKPSQTISSLMNELSIKLITGTYPREYEVFMQLYSTMTKTLWGYTDELSMGFCKDQTITSSEKEEIMSSPRDCRTQLLLNKLALKLRNGNVDLFDKMVKTIQKYKKDTDIQQLATQMQEKFEELNANKSMGKQTVVQERMQKAQSLDLEYKSFMQYHSRLSNIPSLLDLTSYFVTANIITNSDGDAIINTVAESQTAALRKLLNKISLSILRGHGGSRSFDKMLMIMQIYGSDDVQLLANEMLQTVVRLQSPHQITSPNTRLNKEVCPISDCKPLSRTFNHCGGTLTIEDHDVTITVPELAVSRGEEVEIQAVASLIGPYKLPDDYYPISVFVWVGADYTFKKLLRITIPHFASIRDSDEMSDVTVLIANNKELTFNENGDIMLQMHKSTCDDQCEVKSEYCDYYTDHFCSKCLAKRRSLIFKMFSKFTLSTPREVSNANQTRITVFFCVPEYYETADELLIEICICYSIKHCLQVHM